MKLKLKRGTTSKSVRVFVQDATQTDGRGLSTLLYNTSGLTCFYSREGDTGATSFSLVNATVGTWTSGGFKAVDSVNMPGVYELGLPNAVLSAGNTTHLMLKGATGMVPVLAEIELDAVDYQDAAAFGLSRLDASVTSRPTATQNAASILLTPANLLGTDTSNRVTTSNPGGVSSVTEATIWAYTTRTLTDKTGFALTSGEHTNIASDTQTGLTAQGYSAAKAAFLDVSVASRLAASAYTAPNNATITAIAGYVDTEVAAIKAKTDNLPASPAATGDAMTLTTGERTSIGTEVWASTTRTLTSFGTLATSISTAVWSAVSRTLTSGGGGGGGITAADVWAVIAEGTHTYGDAMRLYLAILTGKKTIVGNGDGTYTVRFRDRADTKNRVVGTQDAAGERTGITTIDGT